MGSKLSKVTYNIFEFFNEIFIAVGAGVVGFGVLLVSGFASHQFVLTLIVISLAVFILFHIFRCPNQVKPSINKIVVITGCDSGLGFSVAQHTSDLGFRVVAGCLNLESPGAAELQKEYGDKIKLIQLDITKPDTINAALDAITDILKEDVENVLWAVVNNAGIMTFAEFEWQTEGIIQNQIQTNILGTCLVTKAFCPLLRRYKGRIVNVTSHCAKANLPGLAVYGATKAAIQSFSDGIRVELKKYGVKVVTFIPGSFTKQSYIMANHVEQTYEMQKNFTPEQKLFYNDYFKRYNAYLNCLTTPEGVVKIKDDPLYSSFEHTLLDDSPKAEYINEPIRYKIYHAIFKYFPTCVRDKAITYFMTMPEYDPDCHAPADIAI